MNKRLSIFVSILFLTGAALAIPFVAAQSPGQPVSPGLGPAPTFPPPPGGGQAPAAIPTHPVLSVVVLDPAHGGIDTGARGAGGIRESEVVLNFAGQIRSALQRAGFRVILTREGNDNPSFDERSIIANGQRGAIFITLHIASTGTPSTARVYSLALAQPAAQAPPTAAAPPGAWPVPATPISPGNVPTVLPGDASGILLWDRAQVPFLDLSQRLADIMQVQLSQRFRGSPTLPLTAAVRQLRTVGAPAIAVELSSVSVEDNNGIMSMGPGAADGVAQAVMAFRSYYESSPALSGVGGGR